MAFHDFSSSWPDKMSSFSLQAASYQNRTSGSSETRCKRWPVCKFTADCNTTERNVSNNKSYPQYLQIQAKWNEGWSSTQQESKCLVRKGRESLPSLKWTLMRLCQDSYICLSPSALCTDKDRSSTASTSCRCLPVTTETGYGPLFHLQQLQFMTSYLT